MLSSRTGAFSRGKYVATRALLLIVLTLLGRATSNAQNPNNAQGSNAQGSNSVSSNCPVSNAQAPVKPYLALGDSVPFGFNPFLPLGDLQGYCGYPDFVAAGLSLTLANASCVGESSSSFLQVGAPDLGCQAWRANLPLFVTYSSPTESQLAFAISYLRANPNTSLVTITIGGNDLGLLQAACTAQFTSPSAILDCELAGLPAVYATFSKNLLTIYAGIRNTAGYKGPLIAVNYFSFDYNDAFITGSLGALDAITLGLTSAFGGRVADAFSAFQHASVPGGGFPCAPNVGLAFMQTTNPLTCNPHPTVAGHQLISKLVLNLLQQMHFKLEASPTE